MDFRDFRDLQDLRGIKGFRDSRSFKVFWDFRKAFYDPFKPFFISRTSKAWHDEECKVETLEEAATDFYSKLGREPPLVYAPRLLRKKCRAIISRRKWDELVPLLTISNPVGVKELVRPSEDVDSPEVQKSIGLFTSGCLSEAITGLLADELDASAEDVSVSVGDQSSAGTASASDAASRTSDDRINASMLKVHQLLELVLSSGTCVCADLKGEMTRLDLVLRFGLEWLNSQDTVMITSDKLESVQTACTELVAEKKQLFLKRAMTLFPTGSSIMSTVEKILEAVNKDLILVPEKEQCVKINKDLLAITDLVDETSGAAKFTHQAFKAFSVPSSNS